MTTSKIRTTPASFDTQSLVFDCKFESGNIGNVVRISEYEYEINIRSDTSNNRY